MPQKYSLKARIKSGWVNIWRWGWWIHMIGVHKSLERSSWRNNPTPILCVTMNRVYFFGQHIEIFTSISPYGQNPHSIQSHILNAKAVISVRWKKGLGVHLYIHYSVNVWRKWETAWAIQPFIWLLRESNDLLPPLPAVVLAQYLLGKSHGRRSLVGCGPWGRRESDMTEPLRFGCVLLHLLLIILIV